MRGESLADKLKRDLEETKSHIEEGDKRILAWYRDELDPPDGTRSLDEAPHESLFADAASYLDLASGRLTEFSRRRSNAQYDAELMLYGVAFERLASGVHLKVDTEGFLNSLEDSGKTPWFKDSREVMVQDLSPMLDDEQEKVLERTIDIVWLHRNNEVHLGFHQHRSYQLIPIVLDVAATLLSHYSEEKIDEMVSIHQRIEELRVRDSNSSWEIEFDPDGHLD